MSTKPKNQTRCTDPPQAPKPISKAQAKRDEIARLKAQLAKWLPPGSTVYTILKTVSRSGMYRHVAVLISVDGSLTNISANVATVLDWRWHDDGSVGVSGCGMDAGFHLVHTLSYVLYPNSYVCVGKKRRCPANDHANGDRNYKPHQHSPGAAGYAFRHAWL